MSLDLTAQGISSPITVNINSSQNITIQTSSGVPLKLPISAGTEGQVIALGAGNQLTWVDKGSGPAPIPTLEEPFMIAHRGGPNINPAHTFEAYDYCVSNGFYNIEQDIRLTRDDQMAVIHDPTVNSTTTSTGNVNSFLSLQFKNLNVKAGYGDISDYNLPDTAHPLLMSEVFLRYQDKIFYIPEAKDNCALRIAQMADHYGVLDRTIIQCFTLSQLQQVLTAYPDTITCFLVGTSSSEIAAAAAAGVKYVGFSKGSGAAASVNLVTSILANGMKPIVYTILYQKEWEDFKAIGCVGAFSNDPLYTDDIHTKLKRDPYSSGRWYPGIIKNRGSNAMSIINGRLVISPDRGSDDTTIILQGWACPMQNTTNYTITFDYSVQFQNPTPSGGNWLSIAACYTNEYWYEDNTTDSATAGYHCLARCSGNNLQMYQTSGSNIGTSVGTDSSGSNILAGGTIDPLFANNRTGTITLTVTPTSISYTMLGNTVTYNNSDVRGPYFYLSRRINDVNFPTWGVQFFNVTIV